MFYSKLLYIIILLIIFLNSQLYAEYNIIWEKVLYPDSLINSVPEKVYYINNQVFITYWGQNPKQNLFINSGIICIDNEGEINWKHEILKEKPVHIQFIQKNDNIFDLIGTYTPYAVSPQDPEQINYLLKYSISDSGYYDSEYYDESNDSSLFLGGIIYPYNKFYYVLTSSHTKYIIKEFDNEGKFTKNIFIDSNFNETPISTFSDFIISSNGNFIFLTRHAATYQWGEEFSYIRCIDKNGKIIWKTKLVIDGKYLNLYKILETESNDFILIGRTYTDISTFQATLDKSLAILKVDIEGNIIFEKEIKIDSTTYIDRNIMQSFSGQSSLLYGATKKVNWDDTSNFSSNFNFCIVQINSNGELLPNELIWTNNIEKDNQIIDVSETNDGNYFIYGKSDTNLYLAKIKILPTAVDEEINYAHSVLSLSPNPVTDYLYLKSNFLINKIEIFSALGIKVLETAYQDRIDVSMLSPGFYFLKSGDKIYKFVKI